MMTMFRAYREDNALVVTEAGATIEVDGALLAANGLRALRTGQRLIVTLDAQGAVTAVSLP
jgi:cell envelope opacity-associated protein A